MPKVEIDVGVQNKQEVTDLRNQVVSLQTSLDALRRSAQAGPMGNITGNVEETSRALTRVNQQLEETQKRQRTVASTAWDLYNAWGAYEAVVNFPRTAGSLGRGVRSAYNWGRGLMYGAEAATAAAEVGGVAGVSGGFFAGAARVLGGAFTGASVLAVPAGMAWAANRAAVSVQSDILAARSVLGPTAADPVGTMNDLKIMRYGLANDASPDTMMSLYGQINPRDPAFRALARNRGINIGPDEDRIDALVKISNAIRGSSDYDYRVRVAQTLFTGDPGQNLAVLTSDLDRYRGLTKDATGRDISPSAAANLTKINDAKRWLFNLPLGVRAQAEALGQEYWARAINWTFGSPEAGPGFEGPGASVRIPGLSSGITPAGFVGPLQPDARRAPPFAWMNPDPRIQTYMQANADRAQFSAIYAAMGIGEVRDAMAAEGFKEGTMTYGRGRTLDLRAGTPMEKQVESLKEAKKWADEYLDTWKNKGFAAEKTLKAQVAMLNQIDATLSEMATKGVETVPNWRLPTVLQDRDRVAAQVRTSTSALRALAQYEPMEQTLSDLTYGGHRQLWGLQERISAAQEGLGYEEQFRPRVYGDRTPLAVREFELGRMGVAGRTRAQYERMIKLIDWGPARAEAYELLPRVLADQAAQQRAPFIQQKYGAMIQRVQARARPGQEAATAAEIHMLQLAEAREMRSTRPPEDEDADQQLQLQIRQINASYTAGNEQRLVGEDLMGIQIAGGLDKLGAAVGMQMRSIRSEPGQEMVLAKSNYEQAIFDAGRQRDRDLRSGPANVADFKYQASITQAAAQYNATRVSFARSRNEEERQYRIQGIGMEAQYDIGRMGRWALPGTDLETAARITAREEAALDEEIGAAGSSYTPGRVMSMRRQQGMRAADRIDQVQRVLFERGQQNRVEMVQQELALTERIFQLRAGPGGEYRAAEESHRLRLEALQREKDITTDGETYNRQVRQEELRHTMQLLDLEEGRKQRFQGEVGSLAGTIMQAGPARGLRAWGIGMGQRTALRVTENFAGLIWNNVRDAGIGNLIPGQGTQENPTWLGRLLQGTVLGRSPKFSKDLSDTAALMAPFKENTVAENRNTVALQELTRKIEQLGMQTGTHGPGSSYGGGCGCGPGGGGGYMGFAGGFHPSPGWSGMSIGRPLTNASFSTISYAGEAGFGGSGGYSGYLSSFAGEGGSDIGDLPLNMPGYNPMDPMQTLSSQIASESHMQGLWDMPVTPPAGYSQGAFTSTGRLPTSAKHPTRAAASKAIGTAAAAAAAAYGVYSGIRMGGARGGMTATASALGGLALIPGPQSPFLAAAALGLGVATMMMGDPRQRRWGKISDTLEHARYIEPTPQHYTYTKFGQESMFNQQGGAGPTSVNVSINALDSRSIIDRSVDIANVVAHAVESRQSPRLAAGIRGLVRT